MEEVLRTREELEGERLAQLQQPRQALRKSKNEEALHRFLRQASDMLLGQLDVKQKENMTDVVAIVEYTPPPPDLELPPVAGPSGSPVLLPLGSPISEPPISPPAPRPVAMELGHIPPAFPLPEPGPEAEMGEVVEAEEPEPEDEIMEVDEEAIAPPETSQPEIHDLTQDSDDEVVLIEQPPPQGPDAHASPARSPSRADTIAVQSPSHSPQDDVAESPEMPAIPMSPRQQQAIAEDEDDQNISMQGVEEQTQAVIHSEPLTQNNSEDHVLNLIGSIDSGLPLPISRTASGQYSLSSLPPSTLFSPSFAFAEESSADVKPRQERKPKPHDIPRSRTINEQYSLPPLNILPADFQRKAKPTRQSRKRDRDKDKGDGKSQSEWAPLGINKWGASIRANPVFKKVAKSTKCLSTRDWNVAITELKLLRTLEKVEHLKDAGRWSFRQPKKQRGVGGLMKTHRDYLMDEMKWMRIDFREERRWKLALAYNLAHSVMEWHEAGSLEERVRRGICVLWKRPRDEEVLKEDPPDRIAESELILRDDDEDGEESKQNSTPGDGYASDDESEDEQEKEHQDVLDALEPTAVIQDELDQQDAASQDLHPKLEDVEDLSALQNGDNSMDAEAQSAENAPDTSTSTKAEDAVEEGSGLKETSLNPILGVAPTQGGSKAPVSKSKFKSSAYAPLREQIIYSDLDSLFVDLDDFDLSKGMSELSTDDAFAPTPLLPSDLSSIFPDLQPFGLLDVAPPPGTDGKRKSDRRADKDDPNKRAEATTYTKLVPTNEFMYQKPTLLGPLDPAQHWSDGIWHDLEVTAVVAHFDSPSARPIDDSITSGLFGTNIAPRPSGLMLKGRTAPHGMASLPGVKIDPATGAMKLRPSDHTWTPQDDAILKHLVEKYPGNWTLIADAFNSCRITISTDKRTPSDCCARWTRNLNPTSGEEEPRATPQASTTQMTTRGIKRSFTAMSTSAANLSTPTTSQTAEPKKRRHSLMLDTLRKIAKKRDQGQKSQINQRKPAQIHDTHTQYSKMPRYTPAELSRMKVEKDVRDNHEYMLRMKRQEEAARQQQQLLQQQRGHQGPPNSPSGQQNGAPRTPTNGIPAAQGVPQIRQQVNISQQQRISNQMALQNPRLSTASTQAMQAQAQARAIAAMQAQVAAQAQAQAQVQIQGQTQAQVQPQASMSNSLAANVAPALSSAHLSPAYVGRTTSSSPGLPQQSPPLLAAAAIASNANSPRPPSAQAHLSMAAAQQATPRTAAAVAALAHYYPSQASNIHPQQMTAEQVDQTHRLRVLLQQQAAIQQQQAALNNPYPQS